MGIMSNTCSICHFRVQGELTHDEGIFAVPQLLSQHGFRSIDDTTDELSTGWVHLDDPKRTDFPTDLCWRDHYIVFSMRRDQRKVPTALLKEHVDKACAKWLEEQPTFTKVPKMKKEEIKEAVRLTLLTKALPDPKTYDVVWNTKTGIVTFATLSAKTIELFEDLFKRTFDGLRLTAFHPYERAMSVLWGEDRGRLRAANKATTENYLELIKENRWLDMDFMHWLIYRTLNSDSEYRVNQEGPMGKGEPFVGYINDKMLLCREADGGTQYTAISGPQDQFTEVKSALADRKRIIEATFHLEAEDEKWALTLKGEMFHFASFACPPVKLEKDNTVDEDLEREAVFFERMSLMDKGLQLFDSLFATFLHVRLGDRWPAVEAEIWGWLEAA